VVRVSNTVPEYEKPLLLRTVRANILQEAFTHSVIQAAIMYFWALLIDLSNKAKQSKVHPRTGHEGTEVE
jgi:hypothetical protein